VRDPAAAAGVRAALERRGVKVEAVRPIEPSLEDVFVSLMSREATGGF
jgi:hypothetical protein